MKNNAQKELLLLGAAGLVLIIVNVAVFMGTRNGQIAPVESFMLWGAFAVLNVCSLLWAVSLLGLQPMVVAVSYTAGGIIAYQGVRLMPEVNVAEIATAGATYSAFGALVIGNATAKVRLAFFTKRQVPFIFVILALLLMDSLLNSRVSNAGWNVIANALVIPFLGSGVLVGLAWMVVSRGRTKRAVIGKEVEVIEQEAPIENAAAEDEEVAQLVFSVPESAASVEAEAIEEAVVTRDPEPVTGNISTAPVMEEASPQKDPVEEDDFSDNFFPLEIDKGEDDLLLETNQNLMGVAAMVAESAPVPDEEVEPVMEIEPVKAIEPVVKVEPGISVEPIMETESVVEDTIYHSEESPLSPSRPEPAEKVENDVLKKEGKANSGDWLNSHLDLLNKLN